jgi:predicted GTPase
MSDGASLRTRLVDVCAAVADRLDSPTRAEVLEVSRRLCGPLRIVVDGSPGSGKSTLVNALFSRRVAPTPAGEPTRIVTQFRYATRIGSM